MRIWAMTFIAAASLSACTNTGLRDLQGTGDGPDEFLVLPSKPLQQPENFNALPVPTPGGTNLTDTQPLAEGVAALGGQRTSPNAGIPASDGALVTRASRFGTSPDIRTQLASEDEQFRKRRGRFTQIKLFRVDRYNEVYSRENIDAHRVNDQYERAGVKTPSAPPGP